jgi:hypothetical protein
MTRVRTVRHAVLFAIQYLPGHSQPASTRSRTQRPALHLGRRTAQDETGLIRIIAIEHEALGATRGIAQAPECLEELNAKVIALDTNFVGRKADDDSRERDRG